MIFKHIFYYKFLTTPNTKTLNEKVKYLTKKKKKKKKKKREGDERERERGYFYISDKIIYSYKKLSLTNKKLKVQFCWSHSLKKKFELRDDLGWVVKIDEFWFAHQIMASIVLWIMDIQWINVCYKTDVPNIVYNQIMDFFWNWDLEWYVDSLVLSALKVQVRVTSSIELSKFKVISNKLKS